MQVRKVLLTIALMLSYVSVTAEEAIVLEQESSPLQITNYTNRYLAPDRVGDGTIMHRTSVQNVSGQEVLAYGIGFYIFDSFKRDMGRPFIGYAMTPIATDSRGSPGWEQRPSSAFLFENNGQGLAYVAIVRFADGSVWTADESEINFQIQDFELELTSPETE